MTISFRTLSVFFLIPMGVMVIGLYIVLKHNMRPVSKGSETVSSEVRLMEDAERLYINQCASCHGGAGQGLKGMGISLQESRLSQDQLAQVIHEGRPLLGMPSFGDRFRPEDISVLAAYVKQFQKSE